MTATARQSGDNGAEPLSAIVLLSGGLDSATTLAIARDRGFACHGITFDYGQRHRVELNAATRIAQHMKIASHSVVRLDMNVFSGFAGSALTDDIAVPKDRNDDEMATGIPVTYVPARNTIFLSYALALAESLKSNDIFIGVNAVDYSGYPDCRPQYIEAFETMANLATKAAVEGQALRINVPLIDWPKTTIIRTGLDLGVDYGLTHSCYDPIADASHPLGHRPCGRCDSCHLRLAAFDELNMTDPSVS